MLTVSIDPAVPVEDRPALFVRTVRRLRSIAAQTATRDQLPDLLRTIDAGRLLVAPEVYAELDDDAGLLVTEFEPGDLDVAVVAPETAEDGPDGENGPETPGSAGDDATGDETGDQNDGDTADETKTPGDEVPKVEELRGEALDEALRAAGLSTSGKVADKRARLAEHTANAGTTGTTNTEE